MSSSVNAKHLLAMKLQLADNQNGDHLAMSDERGASLFQLFHFTNFSSLFSQIALLELFHNQ